MTIDSDQHTSTAPADTEQQQPGLMEQARNWVHEKVQTDEQKTEEKPFFGRVEDKMPENAAEAGRSVGQSIDNAANDIQENFNQRLEEDNTGKSETEKKGESLADTIGDKFTQARENLADATKSDGEKARDEFEAKPMNEQLDQALNGEGIPKDPRTN